jgi:hypothetical protein
VWVSTTPVHCQGCHDLAFANDDCVVSGHPCMAALDSERLWPLVQAAWRGGGAERLRDLSCA